MATIDKTRYCKKLKIKPMKKNKVNNPSCFGGINTDKYFTHAEIKEIKASSFPFPIIVYEGTNPKNVIEIIEIISIGGMANNNGKITEITAYKHVKGKETERLVYKLVK